MKTTIKTSLKASLIAVAIASLPLGSHAAGLGQINVFSGLGQPLRAEIQVSATPQELQSLSARIGSPEAFRAANLAYAPVVTGLRVSVDTRASRPVIRLSSDRPINEPFVDVLVELDWANGRLAREYTFLLDPVDIAAPKPVAAAVAAPAARAAVAPPVRLPAATPAVSAPERYTVRRGDTLRRIAGANLHAGTSLDQMLIALFRANPGAFDDENISRLRAGSVLTVPTADAVRAIDPAEARREIRAQAADFQAYRKGLASAAAAQRPTPAADAGQASAGQVVPRVEDARAAADAGDQVRVSTARAEGTGDAESRLQALEEELATREKALEEANARLGQLEQSIRDLQKLLEVQGGSLGQMQQQAGAAPAAPAAPDPAVVTAPPPVAAEAQPVPAPTAAAPSAPTAPAAPAQPAPPAAAPEPQQPSFVDSLMADPALVAGGGGILVLLLAYAGLKARQRRNEAEAAASGGALLSEFPADSQAAFGGTGGQSVDTGHSLIHTDFSQSGLSNIDTDEGVDPVAEADVYMAYGRDAQAEEILQDALKADPTRTAIHLKLLEIYAQRKSVKQFEAVATELFSRSGGQGRDWEKAAALGRKLDPENALYNKAEEADDDIFAPRTEMPGGVVPGVAAAAAAAAATTLTEGEPRRAQAAATDAAAAAKPADDASKGVPADAGADKPDAQSLSSLDFTSSAPGAEPSLSQMKNTWTMPGDIGQLSGDGQEDKSAASPDAGSGAAGDESGDTPEIDVDAIDFELDLDADADTDADLQASTPPAAKASASADVAASAPPAEQDHDLTFDLDLGDGEAEAAPAAAADSDPSEVTMLDDIRGMVDDGLEFDLPDFDADTAKSDTFDLNATVVHSAPDGSGAQGPDEPEAAGSREEDETGQLDKEKADEDSAEAAPDAPVVDLEKTSFDSNLLDFDFDIETPAESPVPDTPALDLTSIDLDLPTFDDELSLDPDAKSPTQATIESTQLSQASEDGGQALNDDEVDTKFELARAYDEMGDKEGALELLNEVLRDGSAAQQAAAREMIAKLG